MAVPFASSYQPINQLNAAIMAQDQLAQQAELQRRQMDNQGVNEAMNRIIQARAIEQQGRNQQQHYGLQQQQLANDLAYRNAALGQQHAQQVEAARQFDAQFGLNKQLTEAQLKNPFFGAGKDFAAYGLQAGQDVSAHNAAATAIASQATGALAAARQAFKTEVAQINDPNWYQWAIRKLPISATKDDLLNAAKTKFDASYSKILGDLGPHRDKVSFEGTPEDDSGVFKAVLLSPPTMPGMQPRPQPQVEQPKVDTGGTEIQPEASANPFLNSPFMQQIMTGKAQENTPPVNFVPASTNRMFRFDPQRGLVPIQ